MLQWGRAFSSAEIDSDPKEYFAQINASMGPRFFKRGNSIGIYIKIAF